MRKLAIALALLAAPAYAQPVDVLRDVVVLKVPGMESVDVRKDIKYGGDRKLDLYLPPDAKGSLPVVVFVNGVGQPALKEWGQYTSWPRLVATRGIAAISYETTGNDAATLTQTEELLKYLREHAGELKIDPSRIAIWACSANVRTGTALLAAHDFRAAAFYYGIMTTAPARANVPVLVTRAGLDVLTINESIDRWVAQAVALDAPVTLVTYPQGRHGFELIDDTAESRLIVRQTLDFLESHLENAPATHGEPITPAQLQRLLRDSGTAAFIARVREIHKSHPNAIAINELALNGLGYGLMQERKVADAISVFELIVSLYPNSANAHDSLGDAYEAAGRNDDAIRESERALAMLENAPPGRRDAIRASAEDKLKRLRK